MTNRLIHGDCLKVPLPPNYFDTLITDPPYGLGFMGKDWDAGVPGKAFWEKFLDACKPGAFAFVFGGTRTYHRLACAIEDAGWEIRDCMMWLYGSGFPKSLDISKAIDKAKGVGREVIGVGHGITGNATRNHSGLHSDDNYEWPSAKDGTYSITTPSTDLAKSWEGYGTALKPAWEPIIVAMKPLDGTFAHNAEKWDVGGLWIDGGRIEYQDDSDRASATPQGKCTSKEVSAIGAEPDAGRDLQRVDFQRPEQKGRWPANVILNEEAGAMLDEQTGGASRFFYCPKAGKKERNEGLDCEPQITDDGRDKKIDNPYLRGKTLRQNNHPTVKPLALMEYLCKLSRPPQGGIVLDPFVGSGTTALACVNTDRQYVAIEKEQEYCEIIAARLGGVPIETTIPQRPRLS